MINVKLISKLLKEKYIIEAEEYSIFPADFFNKNYETLKVILMKDEEVITVSGITNREIASKIVKLKTGAKR